MGDDISLAECEKIIEKYEDGKIDLDEWELIELADSLIDFDSRWGEPFESVSVKYCLDVSRELLQG